MWKENLNIDTEIIVKDSGELEAARAAGDYDLVRRGLVFPTVDSTASFLAIFRSDMDKRAISDKKNIDKQVLNAINNNRAVSESEPENNPHGAPGGSHTEVPVGIPTLTEEQAIFELRAIPLYFPTSYSLVKPYVRGFEINGLDAPSLRDVVIDSNWQPKAASGE
jgi:hypothetical protein